MKATARAGGICVAFAVLATPCAAQELSPRSYWPAPRGTKLLVVGYSHSSGDVLTDPSLPVVGVDSSIDRGALAYLHFFRLAGRTANVLVEMPYTAGNTQGFLEGQPASRYVEGPGDVTATLAVNIKGAPSMNAAEFQELRSKPHPILGASLKVLAPTGDYDADRLINVGTNRWAIKPGLGCMIPMKPKWLIEMELGAWFFEDNDEFLGVTREQRPIVAAELHLVKRFQPGFWAALDFNYYRGGRTTVGGEVRQDLQRNSRIGATVVYPFAGRHAIKAGYSIGVVTESGGDFRTLLVSYQLLFR